MTNWQMEARHYKDECSRLIAENSKIKNEALLLENYKDELMKIAADLGEPDDPFAAWESIGAMAEELRQWRAGQGETNLRGFAADRIAHIEEEILYLKERLQIDPGGGDNIEVAESRIQELENKVRKLCRACEVALSYIDINREWKNEYDPVMILTEALEDEISHVDFGD